MRGSVAKAFRRPPSSSVTVAPRITLGVAWVMGAAVFWKKCNAMLRVVALRKQFGGWFGRGLLQRKRFRQISSNAGLSK
jgi:hypothetical protein